MEFTASSGPMVFWRYFPSIMKLFHLLWPEVLLRDIVHETNRYAKYVHLLGNTIGGNNWEDITISSLKVFLAICLYMGMKKQPNMNSYWNHKSTIFHCPIISQLMSRTRFLNILRCLHITNPDNYINDKALPGYNKLGQVR